MENKKRFPKRLPRNKNGEIKMESLSAKQASLCLEYTKSLPIDEKGKVDTNAMTLGQKLQDYRINYIIE